MIAVDTNVLLRLLTADDREQAAAARDLFKTEQIWIAKTVLLETGWVLRSLYGFEEPAIRDAFAKLLGLRHIEVEDEPSAAAALALTTHGIELADAMHLSSKPHGAAFHLLRPNLRSPREESRNRQRLRGTIPETLMRSGPY